MKDLIRTLKNLPFYLYLDFSPEARQRLRQEKNGRLKLATLDTMPVLAGAIMGASDRASGTNGMITSIPVVADGILCAAGGRPESWTRYALSVAKYCAGAALPYADKVAYAAQTLADKF